ncbi:yippee zinc-binding/DNA-binding /Mis18, centromere assembly-domain-containing protein [Lipomyces kononenkoae]|uniref:Yippee zinc-binding/DNA-binding /Mis18, centromere assembly-domain-containing protein n=1 Tax=Lipomyces kononenkoae TaxID=34357 RepID=A0ACC3T940_LIPKO
MHSIPVTNVHLPGKTICVNLSNPPERQSSTITLTLVLFFVAFLLWQVLLASLIVRPGFYYPVTVNSPAQNSSTADPDSHGVSERSRSAIEFASGRELHSTSVYSIKRHSVRMLHPKEILSYLSPPRKRVHAVEDDQNSSDESDSIDEYFSSRRRVSSVSSVSSIAGSAISGALASPKRAAETLLPDTHPHPLTIFRCRRCQAHLVPYACIISKSFTGRLGRAVLVSDVQNVIVGKPGERMLVTGLHTVADISCAGCDINVGWKYLGAFERSQSYKVGKYILELKRVVKETAAVGADEDTMDYIPRLDVQKLESELWSARPTMRRASTSSVLRSLLDNEVLRAKSVEAENTNVSGPSEVMVE